MHYDLVNTPVEESVHRYLLVFLYFQCLINGCIHLDLSIEEKKVATKEWKKNKSTYY